MNLIQILMTPNVVINNILTFLCTIIEGGLYQSFFSSLLKIKISKKEAIIYIFSTSITAFFINLLIPNPFSYLINLCVFFIFMHFFSNKTLGTLVLL